MPITKIIFRLLCAVLLIHTGTSCSDSNDTTVHTQTGNTSYYKINSGHSTYNSKTLTSALGVFVATTDGTTGEQLRLTTLQVEDEQVVLLIQAREVNGHIMPLSNQQESNNSFISVAIDGIGYYATSGSITIKENNPYQTHNNGGMTETLMEFSGTFINVNDENDTQNISGEAYVKKLY